MRLLAFAALALVSSRAAASDDVAVVIGISDYYVLPDIAGAADEARAWHAHIVSTRGIRSDRATLLVDGDGTKERIEQALKNAVAQAKPTGRVYFVFIGHGAQSTAGNDTLLLGGDTLAQPDSATTRGVAQSTVNAILAGGPQVETVQIIDAMRTKAPGATPALVELLARAPPPAAVDRRRVPDLFDGPAPASPSARSAAEKIFREGHALFVTADCEGAMPFLVKAAKADGSYGEPYRDIAMCHKKSGDKNAACSAAKEFTKRKKMTGAVQDQTLAVFCN